MFLCHTNIYERKKLIGISLVKELVLVHLTRLCNYLEDYLEHQA